MKRIYFLLPLLGILFFIVSCNNNNSHDNKTILTERIQYPVFIKCPYEEETDWWKENLEGPKREKFVNLLLDAVAEGKVKAYDYIDNSELSKKHIGHIFSRSDTLLMPSSVPPYDEKDTIINVKLERKDIHRLTFLEE
ncbi:MAG: hypothetical protein PHR81_08715 [Bacteroidales bacterium]|nr:hypothetical protein [Bacteroidales bacterium]